MSVLWISGEWDILTVLTILFLERKFMDIWKYMNILYNVILEFTLIFLAEAAMLLTIVAALLSAFSDLFTIYLTGAVCVIIYVFYLF